MVDRGIMSYRPGSLAQALKQRRETGALPFAGGTDLMVRYRKPAGFLPALPDSILFINHLEELKYIEKRENALHIGGAATLTQVIEHPDTPEILKKAVQEIAAPALRNAGTLAGNVCNASPAGDSICALYALNAELVLSSETGSRTLVIDEFITGPGKTVLRKEELLTEIIVPLEAWNVICYRKVGTRKANALSKLSFCAVARISGIPGESGRTISAVRIAFGAVAPVVVRNRNAEALLEGLAGEGLAGISGRVLDEYSKGIVPIDDQRSTAVYRKEVSLNLLKRFLGTELAASLD